MRARSGCAEPIRLAAKYITLLRRALVADVVQLEDLALQEFGGAETPEAKAFLVMLGPLAVNAESLLRWAERDENVERMVRTLLSSRRVVDIEAEYAAYERQRERFLRDYYGPYQAASKAYIERGAAMAAEAEAAWLEIQTELDASWNAYRAAQETFFNGYIDLVRRHDMVAEFMRFDERRRRCRNAGCVDRQVRRYERTMRRVTDPPPDWRSFCDIVPPPERNRGREALGRLLRGEHPIEILVDAALGDGNQEPPTHYACNPSVDRFALQLAHHDEAKFVAHPDNRSKLPLRLLRTEYMNDPRVAASAARELSARHGITLPAHWRATDHLTFYATFERMAEARALEQLDNALGNFGDAVPVGLDVRRFEQLPEVQRRLRKTAGENYVDGFSLMLSERDFAARILRPRIERAIRAELASFREGAARFADDGPDAEEGREHVRLVLIPPIAVALSLLFSFVSLAKVSSSLTPLAMGVLNIPDGRETAPAAVLYAAPIVAMVALPFMLTNSYAESKAWRVLSEQAAARSPTTALMSEYVMRVQPMFATVGYPVLRIWDPYGLSPGAAVDENAAPEPATSRSRKP